MNGVPWLAFEGDIASILQVYQQPLRALSRGDLPAFILRRAFDPAHCKGLVDRFYRQGLLYDPRIGSNEDVPRIDIGTSLVNQCEDMDQFFALAESTHTLFTSLFDGYENPVDFIYTTLSSLAPKKRVVVAREPDGRQYGPAIFRTYYKGVGHPPHFDSARKREQLSALQVARFDKQFAGVLCLQEADSDGNYAQTLLYNCQWASELSPQLPRFRSYAEEHGIERVSIALHPGDFYLFCTETIHEMPAISGDQPRVVLACFFGFSEEDEEIYGWS